MEPSDVIGRIADHRKARVPRFHHHRQNAVEHPVAADRADDPYAGVEPLTNTPDQFGAFIKSETARYGKVIKAAGISS